MKRVRANYLNDLLLLHEWDSSGLFKEQFNLSLY